MRNLMGPFATLIFAGAMIVSVSFLFIVAVSALGHHASAVEFEFRLGTQLIHSAFLHYLFIVAAILGLIGKIPIKSRAKKEGYSLCDTCPFAG